LHPPGNIGRCHLASGGSATRGKPVVGKVGQDLDVKQANAAARNVGLRILSVVRAELGSLDKVVRLVKTWSMPPRTSRTSRR
jgi:hypothetical protein